MALDRNMDDRGIRPEPIVKPSKSLELFRTIMTDLLEHDDPQIRDDANYVLSKLDDGEIGVVCDDGVVVRDDFEGDYIVITQIILGKKLLPAFVVSSGLNAPDVFDHVQKPSFLDIKPSREHMRPVVIKAVSNMAFALRSRAKLNRGSNDE